MLLDEADLMRTELPIVPHSAGTHCSWQGGNAPRHAINCNVTYTECRRASFQLYMQLLPLERGINTHTHVSHMDTPAPTSTAVHQSQRLWLTLPEH